MEFVYDILLISKYGPWTTLNTQLCWFYYLIIIIFSAISLPWVIPNEYIKVDW